MAVSLVAAVLIVGLFIVGIRLMQSPTSALWGNRLGSTAMLLALIWAFVSTGWADIGLVLVYIGIGTAIGLLLAQSVKTIHMPQTVALLNGFGGAASALVVWAAVIGYAGEDAALVFWGTSGLAVGVGALTFSGSVVAVLKLQGIAFRKPVQFPGYGHIFRATLAAAVIITILNAVMVGSMYGVLVPVLVLLCLLGGFLMTLRIGGADMPIVISLLNSFSGIAAAVAGLAVENFVLVGAGSLVGVAGLVLTRIMCQAMNRSLLAVLTGFTPGAHAQTQGEKEEPEEAAEPKSAALGEADLPGILREAKRVIIVPGYGMAVSHAQDAVRQLTNAFEKNGAEVKFAMHPVAGRMPGHMYVLLAEVGIDYDKLMDLKPINPQFAHADLALIVGACDVVNPAANAAENTPISGMPILNAGEAKNVVVCNLDEKPGYSGVDNTLYHQEHVITVWGDASETVPRLTEMLTSG